MYRGDIRLGDTIDFKFCTVQSTGAPITLAGTPSLSAYPGNSTTQITAGITLSVDFDGVTGLHNVRIVASGGNGYLTATNYEVTIAAGTINGVSAVGYVVGAFSIENRSALMPTTAARTLVVDAAGLADANVVKVGPTGAGTAQTARDVGGSVLLSAGTGTGQLDFTSGVVKANLAQILGTALTETAGFLAAGFKKFFNVSATPSSTMDVLSRVTLTDTVTTYTGNTVQTGDAFARIGAAGAGLTALGDTRIANLDATITSRTKPADTQAAVTNVIGVGTAAISNTSFAAGAFDAAALATDAIGSSELAASAATKIANAIAALACTEPTNAPAASPTLIQALSWQHTLSRNKITQTATDQVLKADDGATTIATAPVSDDGTTATRGEFV